MSAPFWLTSAEAAEICTNLPPSQLQIYQVRAQNVEERLVPTDRLKERDRDIEDEFVSRHAMMLSGAEMGIWYSIQHRVLPRGDKLFCDAPVVVQVIVGSNRRIALLARGAAEDKCLRQHMLDHELAHTRAFEAAIGEFIVNQRSFLQQGLVALKQTPGSSPEAAIGQWTEGVRLLVSEARGRLIDDLKGANREVDSSAAMTALENACDGRMRALEGNP